MPPQSTDSSGSQNRTSPSSLSRNRTFIRIMNVRLRFVFLMVIVGLVTGYWETIVNYYDRWTRPAIVADTVEVSEVEFYCAMYPNIVRSTRTEHGHAARSSQMARTLRTRQQSP